MRRALHSFVLKMDQGALVPRDLVERNLNLKAVI